MSRFLLLAAFLALSHAQGAASISECAEGEEKVDGKCVVVFDIYTKEIGNWTRVEMFGRSHTYWAGPLKQSLLSVVSTRDFFETPWSSMPGPSPSEIIVVRTMRCSNPTTLNTSWEAHAWNEDLGLARWSMYNTSLAGLMCGDYGASLDVFHTKINVTKFLQSGFFAGNRYAPARHHTLEECHSFGVEIPEGINFVIWISNPHNTSLSDAENFDLYGIQTLSRMPPLSYSCWNETISTGMGMSDVALSQALSDVVRSGRCAIPAVLQTSPEVASQSFSVNASILI